MEQQIQQTSYHQKKKIVFTAIIIILVFLGLGIYYVVTKKHTTNTPEKPSLTPIETLQKLDEQSAPTLKDPNNLAQALKKINTNTKPIKETRQDRQNIIDVLNKK
ncbi:MAG: hypothetical protein WCQ32_00395 [bacterium]